jgi:hypothetical protein
VFMGQPCFRGFSMTRLDLLYLCLHISLSLHQVHMEPISNEHNFPTSNLPPLPLAFDSPDEMGWNKYQGVREAEQRLNAFGSLYEHVSPSILNANERHCSVCLDESGKFAVFRSNKEDAVQLPCGHVFGGKFLDKWFLDNEQNACLLCFRDYQAHLNWGDDPLVYFLGCLPPKTALWCEACWPLSSADSLWLRKEVVLEAKAVTMGGPCPIPH